jgi:hypothetical protein
MVDVIPRWLNREQVAAYVGRRVDELPRLVRAGKLPAASLHFGPRSPRWDRLALDALFEPPKRSDGLDMDAIEQEAINCIIERARRSRAARGLSKPRGDQPNDQDHQKQTPQRGASSDRRAAASA